jgi:RHS repeat-associated protein
LAYPELEFTGDLDAGDADAPFHFEHCRWYDPTLGRWMNGEPIGFLDDVNVSRYVYNGDGK